MQIMPHACRSALLVLVPAAPRGGGVAGVACKHHPVLEQETDTGRHETTRATFATPRVGILVVNSIGPLPYAKGLSGAARAGRQQSRARGWSWVLVIACRTLVKPRGPGCAGETARACPAMLESFLSTPLRAACPWTGSGPSRSLWMAAPVLAACTARCPNRASSEATSVF